MCPSVNAANYEVTIGFFFAEAISLYLQEDGGKENDSRLHCH